MKYISRLLAITLGTMAATTSLTAAVLGAFDFEASAEASSSKPGLTFSTFSPAPGSGLTGSVATDGSGGYYESSGWPNNGSLDLDQFVGFSILADPGTTFTLRKITFDSWTGQMGAKLKVAIFDGVSTSTEEVLMQTTINSGRVSYYWDFLNIRDLESATFNFYGFKVGNNNNSDVINFDNVNVYGAVVPEPYHYGLAAIVLLAGIVAREHRLRRVKT